MSEIKNYLTADDEIFKTVVDLGDVNPKEYTLEHLLIAEKRLIKGTNKTLRAALNSTRSMVKKNSNSAKKIGKVQMDEYGLDSSIYTDQQIGYIKNKIKEFSDVYDVSTPFSMEIVISMAKNRLKSAEVEAKMISSDNGNYIKQKIDLQKDFSGMAEDLKMRPKDSRGEDKSKNRNSLTEMIRRYEARVRSGKLETSEKTEEMRKKLSEIRAGHKNEKFAEKGE